MVWSTLEFSTNKRVLKLLLLQSSCNCRYFNNEQNAVKNMHAAAACND